MRQGVGTQHVQRVGPQRPAGQEKDDCAAQGQPIEQRAVSSTMLTISTPIKANASTKFMTEAGSATARAYALVTIKVRLRVHHPCGRLTLHAPSETQPMTLIDPLLLAS